MEENAGLGPGDGIGQMKIGECFRQKDSQFLGTEV